MNDQLDNSEIQQVDVAEGSMPSDESGQIGVAQQIDVATPSFQSLSNSPATANVNHDIDLILDIPVQLTVELGRTKIPIKNILRIGQGAVVELDSAAGDPLDVFVNGCLIAKGEVVVVNDHFGIRLTDIITPSERMKKINR